MAIIETHIDSHSEYYHKNCAHMQALVNELNSRRENVILGGSWQAREKHQKQGKLLARERIEVLLDKGSRFWELSPLAGADLYTEPLPAGAIITGIGLVHGHAVMLIVNDATVKGGTYYPITVKKHLRAQAIARENRLPCIHLVDSGGAYLPMQDEVFPDKEGFGRIFYHQARLAADGIPQIAVVMGPCIAGGAYVAAMSDETIIVKNQGTIYLGGPQLVQAATGECSDAENLGGGEMHCKISGVADHLAENDNQALEICRNIIAHLPESSLSKTGQFKPPRYKMEEIYGIVPGDIRQSFNIYEIIARLVDDSEFQEFKALYGVTLVCGFAHIGGFPIAIIANNGILFSQSALKGTHFIELCNQRQIPILFLQNIAGFMVGKHYEHHGISKDGAKMVTAVATTTVAKFTIIIGGSFGAGNYAMCGRAYGARLLWSWPNARISVMGSDVAAALMGHLKKQSDASQEPPQQAIREQFEQQGSPYYSTARLWDDGVIDPLETRDYLINALRISAIAKHGINEGIGNGNSYGHGQPIYRM